MPYRRVYNLSSTNQVRIKNDTLNKHREGAANFRNQKIENHSEHPCASARVCSAANWTTRTYDVATESASVVALAKSGLSTSQQHMWQPGLGKPRAAEGVEDNNGGRLAGMAWQQKHHDPDSILIVC